MNQKTLEMFVVHNGRAGFSQVDWRPGTTPHWLGPMGLACVRLLPHAYNGRGRYSGESTTPALPTNRVPTLRNA